MSLHVAFQLAGLSAGMVAEVALVRFLSGMTAPVDDQVALELKRLSTKLTRLCLQSWHGWRLLSGC